jgi:filamentous hemagglutinin
MYRSYSDPNRKLGPYWTRTEPAGPVQSILDSALDPRWGNLATSVVKVEVPAGTRVFEGVVAPQRGLVGGGDQVFLKHVDENWVTP